MKSNAQPRRPADPTQRASRASGGRDVRFAVAAAALGYFVDIYDLLLFSIVRIGSLRAIGVPEERLLDDGVFLLNVQMCGMLIGGIFWGVLGDRRGRLSVLFGSIALYSAANLSNAFVGDLGWYAALRFVAGVGLAGELGAGVTLVSELMERGARGWGTTVIGGFGLCGAVAAALVGELLDWRTAYLVGGALGMALLVLRIGVVESGMFEGVKRSSARRGHFFALFADPSRALRYLSVILIAVPIWYAVAVLVTFAPELGRAMGMTELPSPGRAILCTYAGQVLGDVASGTASQLLRSRKRVVAIFLGLTVAALAVYFTLAARSLVGFYAVCVGLGVAIGYWAVFMTIAAEQFGTNLRATATTTAPNFVRGSVVLVTLAFQKGEPLFGVVGSAIAVGIGVLGLAFWSLRRLDETFGKDLDFIER